MRGGRVSTKFFNPLHSHHSSVLPLSRSLPMPTFFLLRLLFLFSFLLIFSESSTVRWRYPGVSGRWENPFNWKVDGSGAARLPGQSDDVVIGNDWAFPYPTTFTVTLESRSGNEVKVKSLSLPYNPSCGRSLCNGTRTYWYYNSSASSWQSYDDHWDQDGKPCQVKLVVVAPTRLTVGTNFTAESFTTLVFTGSRESITDLSYVRAARTEVLGPFFGSAEFEGYLSMTTPAKTMQVLYLNVDGSAPVGSPFAGTLHVHGDMVFQRDAQFYASAKTGEHTRVIVDGDLTYQATAPYVHVLGGTGQGMTFPVFSFGSSDVNESRPAFFTAEITSIDLFDPFVPSSCTVLPGENFTPDKCLQVSENTIGILVGLSGDCCAGTGTGASCQPLCPGIPMCNLRGQCTGSPSYCDCDDGWTGFACEIADCPGTPDCNRRGLCVHDSSAAAPHCECDFGWDSTPDCSVPLCPNNCSGRGECFTSGETPTCVCHVGWQLGPYLDCSVHSTQCPGRPGPCSGHGTCDVDSGNCTCNASWDGFDCSLAICPGGCSHHGVCVDNGTGGTKCQCSQGWTGTDCSIASCPNNCSGHGTCSSDLDPPRCICDAPDTLLASQPSDAISNHYGWTGADCSQSRVPDCLSSASYCNGGTCGNVTTGLTCLMNTCPSGYTGWDCSLRICENTGIPECNSHGLCEAAGGNVQCACRNGWLAGSMNDCQAARCEVEGCSKRGTCRTDLSEPTCACDPYYYGADCSEADCPGTPACTSAEQGQCVNGTCVCEPQWQGGDCSIPKCPSFNGADCNAQGKCDTSAIPFSCSCDAYWYGVACERPICPNNCSGNGVCDGTRSPPVCSCDEFWSGDDCSVDELASDDDTNPVAIAVPAVLVPLFVLAVTAAVILAAVYLVRKYWWQRRHSSNAGINWSDDADEAEGSADL